MHVTVSPKCDKDLSNSLKIVLSMECVNQTLLIRELALFWQREETTQWNAAF